MKKKSRRNQNQSEPKKFEHGQIQKFAICKPLKERAGPEFPHTPPAKRAKKEVSKKENKFHPE